jgi:hypothetical protein
MTPSDDGGGPFTIEGLRQIIEDVLTQRYNPPTREALKELAADLNGITRAIRASRKFRARIDNEKDEVKKAVIKVNFLLPYGLRNKVHPSALDERTLESFITTTWQSVADHIATVFQIAMWSANFEVEIGDTGPAARSLGYTGGPVPRFITAVVPLITGEKPGPTLGAVTQEMKRRARRAE